MRNISNKFFFNPVTIPVFIITFFTFFSRFLGFVRQYLILRNLNELESDLLLSANKIPELISVVLLMGTIYSSVLPIASRIESKDNKEDKVSAYLNLISISLVAVVLALIIIGIIFTEPLLESFTSKEIWLEAQQSELIGEYILTTRVLFLFPLAFTVQAIWGVFLTLKKRFLAYSLAGVITNFGTIVALAMTRGDFLKVSIGMVWGAWLASILFLFVATRSGFLLPSFNLKWILDRFKYFRDDIIQTWKLFLPRIFVIDGFYAANFLINPLAQSEGQITAFDIGTSIQGAFFIIITSLGTVFFPDLSKTLHDPEISRQVFWDKMFRYLKISVFLGLLVTILTVIGAPIIIYLFQFLGYGQTIGGYIISIAQISSISLTFRAIREILSRYIYVRERIWQPVILSFLGVLALFSTTLLWVRLMGDAGIGSAIGLISYNIIWVIAAYLILRIDYQKDKILSDATKTN